MSMTWLDAVDTIRRARNEAAGKPLANNTRLFVSGEGDERTFRIRYHNTIIITINPDDTYTLANGGYNTVTTLQRIRSLAPVTWQTLFSEKGEWFVRLRPNPKDPRPAIVERKIPRPFTAVNPGPEPTKSTEGCAAGRMITVRHINELVECYRRDMLPGDTLLDVKRESSMSNDNYDMVRVARTWTDHTYYGANRYYDEGWAGLDDNHSVHSTSFVNDDDEMVRYKQCVHCRHFDARHDLWEQRYHGVNRWASIDKRKGYKLYAEMMKRFDGDEDAWQEAYIEDFRARRANLAAEREWDQRNRIPFYDGIVVDSEGYADRLRQTGPSPAKLRRHEAAVERMKKRIEKYIDGYIKALTKGDLPMPGAGDCWYCALRTSEGVPMGDAAQTLHPDGSLTVQPNHEHLISHMEERYYVPSLAVNAIREAGYKDVAVYMFLNMKPEDNKMGGVDNTRKPYDNVRRALRKYMVKRLVTAAPTS